jgi:hypothetical protein
MRVFVAGYKLAAQSLQKDYGLPGYNEHRAIVIQNDKRLKQTSHVTIGIRIPIGNAPSTGIHTEGLVKGRWAGLFLTNRIDCSRIE